MAKKTEEKKTTIFQKIREDERFQKGGGFLWENRIEIISGLLVLIGLILAIFYMYMGDALVGLGAGIYFFPELHRCFLRYKTLYIEGGIFKTLMTLGVPLYLLIVIPIFVLAVLVGYGAMTLLFRSKK